MSHVEIEKSLNFLEKDWDIDPVLRDFVLGKIPEVTDYPVKVKDVIFHIPFLTKEKNTFCGNVTGLIVITAAIDRGDCL